MNEPEPLVVEPVLLAWQKVFRRSCELKREDGQPFLSTTGLRKLAHALAQNDLRLIQGTTTSPLPLACTQDWPVEGSCPWAFILWQGEQEAPTVGPLVDRWTLLCCEVDAAYSEPGAVRHFLNYWDERPREEVRAALLAEVQQELRRREGVPQNHVANAFQGFALAAVQEWDGVRDEDLLHLLALKTGSHFWRRLDEMESVARVVVKEYKEK